MDSIPWVRCASGKVFDNHLDDAGNDPFVIDGDDPVDPDHDDDDDDADTDAGLDRTVVHGDPVFPTTASYSYFPPLICILHVNIIIIVIIFVVIVIEFIIIITKVDKTKSMIIM